MAVIVNGDGILTGISSLATALTDLTSGRGTVTGVATVGTLQLGAGVSISSPRTQTAAIFTNNTEFLTVDDAGRVGVGTITPNSDAHPQNEKKINVGFITARSIAGDIDANTMVVAGVSTFVGALNATSVSGGTISGTTGTFSSTVSVNAGNLDINDSIRHVGDDNTKIRFPTADTFTVETSGTERLRINSSGNLGLGGQTNPQAAVHIQDLSAHGYELRLGGNLLQFNRASLSYIDQANNSGSIAFRMGSSNTEALRITSDANLRLPDNRELQFGGESGNGDMQIYHNGTHNYIDTDANKIHIRVNANENAIVANSNGAVELYHNNVKTLETGAGGNQSIKSGANTFVIGSSDSSGSHLVLDGDSNGDGSGGDYCGVSHESDGNMLIYQDNPNSNGKIDFNTGGSARFSMQSDKFRASNDNACTLGTSGLAWANVFTKGNYVVKGSSGTGVDFAHSASEGTAANILDDYEEGSWTPGFTPLSSAMTIGYDLRIGTYRRIGNVVYWAFRVRLQSLSGQMGQNMGFGGFPYNIDSSQPQFSANIYGSTYSGEIPNGIFYNGNTTYGELFYPSGSGAYTNLQAGDLNPSSSYTVGTGFYFAA